MVAGRGHKTQGHIWKKGVGDWKKLLIWWYMKYILQPKANLKSLPLQTSGIRWIKFPLLLPLPLKNEWEIIGPALCHCAISGFTSRIWNTSSALLTHWRGGDGSPVVRHALDEMLCYCLHVLILYWSILLLGVIKLILFYHALPFLVQTVSGVMEVIIM